MNRRPDDAGDLRRYDGGMSIKITMYSVGLGAAMLLEFRRSDRTVRVLTDGGDAGAGIRVADEVAAALGPVGGAVGPAQPLDLVIGTHYDEDHLDGLTELVGRGVTIPVREIWLPPVADDTLSGSGPTDVTGRAPKDEDTLATRFAAEGGREAFGTYLRDKAATLDHLDEFEQIFELSSGTDEPDADSFRDLRGRDEALGLTRFRRVRGAARRRLAVSGVEHLSGGDVLETGALATHARYVRHLSRRDVGPMERLRFATRGPAEGPLLEMAVASIRNAVCTDAINAGALIRLVEALRARPGIRRRQIWCEEGQPIEFGFDGASGRFDRRSVRGPGPRLTLLGPTERLVAERRDILPVGILAMTRLHPYERLKDLTDSNQLSYVVRFDHDEQGVLITGDTGFDGFAVGSDSVRRYYPHMVHHLRDLSVIQVPHHGGICRHFYRVLDDAGFPQRSKPVYLLLSHEQGSAHRPGDQFMNYAASLGTGHPARLLFTAMPRADKANELRNLAESATIAPGALFGDAVLEFESTWRVVLHSVQL